MTDLDKVALTGMVTTAITGGVGAFLSTTDGRTTGVEAWAVVVVATVCLIVLCLVTWRVNR